MKTVSEHYCNGIKSGRETLNKYGVGIARDELANLRSTIARGFGADSPVGQFLRGERDFWAHQIKRAGGAA